VKKPKLPKKKRMKDIADRLWAIAVKDDWGWKCACCGRSGLLNSHHLLPRQHTATRYNLLNGICLCKRCHQFCPDFSPHQNAAGFSLWLATYPSAYAWVMVNILSGDHKKFDGRTDDAYYCGIILGLKQYVGNTKYLEIVGQKFAEILDEIAVDTESPEV